MTPKEFFDLVVRMRRTQQEYFKTRSSSALAASKKLERSVDAEIERVNRVMSNQKHLFPE